jgi:hypothetical protein
LLTPWPTAAALALAKSAVILSPEHAEIVANSNFSKSDTREFLFEHASRSEENVTQDR